MKPHSPLLSPSEACELAGVGPTTMKRWADQGLLAHVKTAGGHRRFLRVELEQFLKRQTHGTRAERGAPGGAEDPWIRRLIGGLPHEVEAELLLARARLGSWWQVAGEVGGVLVEIGLRWERKELSILDEHVASERLSRALARIGESLPLRPGAPCALLAGCESDDHSLGLALVELCLRELGWRTLWAGTRTPVDELEKVLGLVPLELLALSASAASSDRAELAGVVRRLERPCSARKIRLVLGGEGAWPEHPLHAQRLHDFAAFHRFLSNLPASER